MEYINIFLKAFIQDIYKLFRLNNGIKLNYIK